MYSFYPPLQSPAYAPQYPIIPQLTAPAQPAQPNGIQYVDGKKGAEEYQGPAGIFLDSKVKKFYIKQTDANGVVSVKCYDYTESKDSKPVEYVTKAEFESFKSKMKGVNKNESVNDAGKQ